MPDIMHYLKIQASPERVYQALTTAEGVRNWWTREAELDPHVGGEGEFAFYNRRVVTQVRIDDLKPNARVVWTAISSSASGGWKGTTIAFDLSAEDDGTVLRFSHRGFPAADDGYARVTTGWGYFLVSLQQYLERGQGAPAPDIDFSRMTERAA